MNNNENDTNINNIDNSNELVSKDKATSLPSQDLSELTEKNWLFIKYFFEGKDLKECYKLAGYNGSDYSAPYKLFERLKPKLELVAQSEGVNKARLLANVNKMLGMPLEEGKKTLSFPEMLSLLKFTKDLIPEMDKPKQAPTVFVIQRYSEDKPKDIVDVQPLDNQ